MTMHCGTVLKNIRTCSPEPFSTQVLTRQQQLQAKKAKKDNKGAETNLDENGDEAEDNEEDDEEDEGEPSKKPAARGKAKAKAKATAKASAKSKAKAKAKASAADKSEVEPKCKASPKKRVRGGKKKATEDDAEMADAPQNPEVAEEPAKKPGRKRKPVDAEPEQSKKTKKEEKETKAGKEPETKKGDSKKAETKAKAKPKRKAKKQEIDESPEQMQSLLDDSMKGIILQVLKAVKVMPVDELKTYLKDNHSCQKGIASLNTYWTQTAAAVRLLCVPGNPDCVRFSFKGKSWNARMSAAYMCSVIAASWLILLSALQSWCFFFGKLSCKIQFCSKYIGVSLNFKNNKG